MHNATGSVRAQAREQAQQQRNLHAFFSFCSRSRRALLSLALVLLAPAWAIAEVQMYTPGQFAVRPDGSSYYTIPIQVPPGTAGMQPNLALAYNSRRGNGIVGVGWSLSGLSSIARCPATFVQDGFKGGIKFDSNDRYCLDGQRLIAIKSGLAYNAAGQEYRTEHESFTKVVAFGASGNGPQYFQAWTKAGQILQFGLTTNFFANNSAYPSVAVWPIASVKDQVGNIITFDYFNDGSEFRPKVIMYGGNVNVAGAVPYASVYFNYEGRTDIETDYTGGSFTRTTARLTRIKTCLSQLECSAGSNLVKEYRLTYETSPASARPRLSSLTECDSAGNCLPSTRLTWSGAYPAWGSATGLSAYSPAQGYSDANIYPILSGDFNGDGKTDIARVDNQGVGVSLSTGSGWVGMAGISGNFGRSQGYSDGSVYPIVTGDFNGDGKTDIGRVSGQGFGVYLSTGTGFVGGGGFLGFSPGQGYSNASQYPIMTGDFNGDGRTDIARVDNQGVGVYLSTGSGWVSMAGISGDFGRNQGYTDASVYPIVAGDFNGDGNTDIGRVTSQGFKTYLSTGAGFVAGPGFPALSPQQGYTNASIYPMLTGDFNGDGRTDIARVSIIGVEIYHSTDTGWVPGVRIPYLSPAQGFSNASTYPIFAADFTGDGKTDIARVDGNNVFIFYAAPSGWSGIAAIVGNYSPGQGYTNDLIYPIVRGDWNGDGAAGFARVYNLGVGVVDQLTPVGDLLTSITTGIGATTTIAYKPLTDTSVHTPSTGSTYPLIDLTVPTYVVSSVASSNGIGGTLTNSYTYTGAKAHERGRGFLGFTSITTTEPTSDTSGRPRVTQVSFNQTAYPSTTPFGEIDYRHIGTPVSSSTTLGGVVLATTTNAQLSVSVTQPGVYFEFVGSVTENGYVPNDTLSASTNVMLTRTVTEYGEPTQLGNPTKIAVTTTNAVTGEVHVKTTVNNYYNDQNAWVIGRVSCMAATSQLPDGSAATRTSSVSYRADGLPSGEIVEPGTSCAGSLQPASTDASLRLTTTYGYDPYGNRQSVTVSGGVTGTSLVTSRTSYTYFEAQGANPAGRFPTRVKNALGRQESREFDPRFGGMTTLNDFFNFNITTWTYDGFGRKTTESRDDSTSSSWSYSLCNCAGYADQPYISYIVMSSATSEPNTFEYFDILDRKILKTTQISLTPTYLDSENVWFDAFGRVSKAYRPYIRGNAKYGTSLAYDAANRVTNETAPDGGVTSYSYMGLTTQITPPANVSGGRNVTRKTKNSQGQLTEVINGYGAPAQSRIAYAYEHFGNLTKTTDQRGNVTTMVYDLRGRKISMTDPDMGFWEYKYDALNELVWQQDPVARAAGQAPVTIAYDLLGRMTSRAEPSLTSNWYYDRFKNGSTCRWGKLCEVEASNGYRRVHFHDGSGRETRTEYYLQGTTQPPFVVDKVYGGPGNTDCSAIGKLCLLVYPVGANGTRLVVNYLYNQAGFLSEVRNAGDSTLYWAGAASGMNADLNWANYSYGNGVTTLRGYNAATGRLESINAGAGTVQNHTFSYDLLGNLKARDDNNNNVHETLSYDALNRLTSTSMTGATSLGKSYQYDTIGNITSKSDIGALAYPASGGASVRPHAVSSVTGTVEGVVNPTYTYDANGNMKTALNGARTFTWFSFNMVQGISYNNSLTTFTYDADHNRIREVNDSGTTLFVNPGNALLFEKQSNLGTDNFKHYIPTPVGAVAVYTQTKSATVNTSELKYLHKDHLGSTVVVTSGNGISPVQVLERLSYDPWGKRRSQNGSDASGTGGSATIASSLLSVGGAVGGTTLSVAPSSATAGSVVSVSWSGISAPTTTDWIGLYMPGATSQSWIDWFYVSCSRTAGAARASGSCSFTLPSTLASGNYELRIHSANGFTALATTTLKIGTTLSVTPSSAAASATVTVAWSGITAPTTADWIGLYAPGATSQSWVDWFYVSCSKTVGTARASGSCAFALPSTLANGSYELRLHQNNGFTPIATSGTLSITSGALFSVTPTSGVAAGSTVTVSWSGISAPAATDWIGLYSPGAPAQSYIDWIYVSCSKTAGAARASGSCAFTLPSTLANGGYELRLLRSSSGPTSFTDRGFTEHEHVKTAGDGIIHMNGRVYEANLGRLTSADPNVFAPAASQAFNRYGYVLNNPLSLTDPTGFDFVDPNPFGSGGDVIHDFTGNGGGIVVGGGGSDLGSPFIGSGGGGFSFNNQSGDPFNGSSGAFSNNSFTAQLGFTPLPGDFGFNVPASGSASLGGDGSVQLAFWGSLGTLLTRASPAIATNAVVNVTGMLVVSYQAINTPRDPGTYLFRAMLPGDDGFPQAGSGLNQLGVVVDPSVRQTGVVDIPVNNGWVRPETGGMSVNTDPYAMPKGLLPVEFGGRNTNTVMYAIPREIIPRGLNVNFDTLSHANVEPAWPKTIDTFQLELSSTRLNWIRVTP
jgi:RHS repeat-associated protein